MLKRIVTIVFSLFLLMSFSGQLRASSGRKNKQASESQSLQHPLTAQCRLCQKNKPAENAFRDKQGKLCYFCADCQDYAKCEFCGYPSEWITGGPDEHIYVCIAHAPTVIKTKAEADKNLNEVRQVLSTRFKLKTNGPRECVLVAPKELKDASLSYECCYSNYGIRRGKNFLIAKGMPYDIFRYLVAHLFAHDWVDENLPHLKEEHDLCEWIASFIANEYYYEYDYKRLREIQIDKAYGSGVAQLTMEEEEKFNRNLPHNLREFYRKGRMTPVTVEPGVYSSMRERNADVWKDVLLKAYPASTLKSDMTQADSKQADQEKSPRSTLKCSYCQKEKDGSGFVIVPLEYSGKVVRRLQLCPECNRIPRCRSCQMPTKDTNRLKDPVCKICQSYSTNVNDPAEVQKITEEVSRALASNFKMTLRQKKISTSLDLADNLVTESGRFPAGVYSGNTPQDGHKIVYAGDLFLPVLQFRALAAHELAHAWYVENGFTLVPDGKDPICEGFAQFVAWCLLKDMKAKFPRDNPAFVGIMGMFDEEIRGIEERGDEVYLGGFLKVRDLMGDARTASEWKKIMQKELKKETGKESGKTEKTSANPKQTKQTRPQTKKSGK